MLVKRKLPAVWLNWWEPFVKVEATKFTEVGYVGRDVESMIRDLIETSMRMVKLERTEKVKTRLKKLPMNVSYISWLLPNPSPKST